MNHRSIRRLLLAGTSLAGLGLLGAVPAVAQELNYVTLDYGTSGTFLTGIRGDTIVGNYLLPGGSGSTGGLLYRTDTGVWVPFTDGLYVTLLPDVRFTLPILLTLLTLWMAYRIVNYPTFADFLIATEAEMNKVSWTTRKRLVQDTIVVLVTVLLFTVFIFIVDVIWGWGLSKVGVLQLPTGQTEERKQVDW